MQKEEYELKQRQKEAERQKEAKAHALKKMGKRTAILLILFLVILAGAIYIRKTASRVAVRENEQLSTSGIHWHPHLSIKIKGQEQEIPAGIGIGVAHQPIHTHEADGIIHLEFAGRVTENDARLGKFFAVWGKRFDGECIFDNCSGQDGQLKMFVNGQPSDRFADYIMRDGDQIEIIFE